MCFTDGDPRNQRGLDAYKIHRVPGIHDNSIYSTPLQEIDRPMIYSKPNPKCPKGTDHGQMTLHVVNVKSANVYELVYGCHHPGCSENFRKTIIVG